MSPDDTERQAIETILEKYQEIFVEDDGDGGDHGDEQGPQAGSAAQAPATEA